MPDLLTVTETERETVRVFAVDLPKERAKPWAADPSNIEDAMGAALDPDYVEVIDTGDLAGLGLAAYLTQGHGIEEAQVAPDRDMLDTAGPFVVLARARAFAQRPLDLNPQPPLVPLGVYSQEKAELPSQMEAAALEPVGAAGQVPPYAPTRKRGSLAPLLILVGLAMVILAVMILPKL